MSFTCMHLMWFSVGVHCVHPKERVVSGVRWVGIGEIDSENVIIVFMLVSIE